MDTLTTSTAAALGVLQGLTEFLPISSSGHLVLAHEVLGTLGADGLAFDALLHFATALAIVVYFWRDIRDMLVSLVPASAESRSRARDRMLAVALIVGTIPAAILGLLLEDIMATAFRNPLLVALTLVVGSLIMLAAERYHRLRVQGASLDTGEGGSSESDTGVGWRKGVVIGLFQSLALIPGMSRSGMTIAGGMFFGLDRAFAAKFGFLLGVPLLLGAGAKKILDIGIGDMSTAMLAGTLTAFVVAILVIHYLLRFLRNHTLHVFIVYRLLLAAGIVLVVAVF